MKAWTVTVMNTIMERTLVIMVTIIIVIGKKVILILM